MATNVFPNLREDVREESVTAIDVRAVADDLALEPGTMLGDYQIEKKVAEGGWGTVFSAVHPLIGKRVAVKVLKKQLCWNPAAVQRFIDEARAVNHIGHPNIVDVFTFGETLGGRSYFMMEWLRGETLAARMPRLRVGLPLICSIGKQLARALAAAHAKDIIHRDLKPDNVFLVYVRGEPPRVKLLDFGIAKLATNKPGDEHTSTGEIVGTPAYMAPEQARGRHIDPRVDIYALGGMLFEMLAGRTPFVTDNSADMIALLLTEPAPRASNFVPDLPRELDDLIAAMLAKNPEDRPTLREVCDVLDLVEQQATQREEQESEEPGSQWLEWSVVPWRAVRTATEALGTHVRRRWRVAALVASAALLAIVLTIAIATRGSTPAPAAPVADATHGLLFLNVTGAPAFEISVDHRTVEAGPAGEISLTPGMHAIEIRAPGMATESFMVLTTAGVVSRETVELHRPI